METEEEIDRRLVGKNINSLTTKMQMTNFCLQIFRKYYVQAISY